nr:MAG TPA: hypothetical protein [Caudoviricetes sp.]
MRWSHGEAQELQLVASWRIGLLQKSALKHRLRHKYQ